MIFILFYFFAKKYSRSCDCTGIRTHVPTSEGFEVTNWTTGATGDDSTYSKGIDQRAKVANPARGQLNTGNEYIPVPVRA